MAQESQGLATSFGNLGMRWLDLAVRAHARFAAQGSIDPSPVLNV